MRRKGCNATPLELPMFIQLFRSMSVLAGSLSSSVLRLAVVSTSMMLISPPALATEKANESQPLAKAEKAATAPTTKPQTARSKQVIGAVATVEETQSDLEFTARVDTGATTSSIHVEEWKIADQAKEMTKNLGKKIRFLIKNEEGKSKWLERKITEISVIKTSEQEETRYKVPVTLTCNGVKKKVLVSLNDRSHMKYPMLLGRNYLEGDFLVDVEIDE